MTCEPRAVFVILENRPKIRSTQLTQNAGVYSEVTEKMVLRLEARVGIEPTHKGFADLSLTTWVPRPGI